MEITFCVCVCVYTNGIKHLRTSRHDLLVYQNIEDSDSITLNLHNVTMVQ